MALPHFFLGGVLIAMRSPQDASAVVSANWTVPSSAAILAAGGRSVTGVTVVPLRVEYSDGTREAMISVQWKVVNGGGYFGDSMTIPARALYFTRHIENSPYTYVVNPGEVVAATSSADGS